MNPLVSVICTAYNHEKYIKRTITSIAEQVTNFEFEIIVNDDCSNDNTADILKQLELKFNNLIVIYQNENQYSKGISVSKDILLPKTRGKYIAICEGDDYWLDFNKLQKQIDYMENNQNCTLCFSNAIKYNVSTGYKSTMICESSVIDKKVLNYDDFNAGELALLGFIPTASFVIKSEIYKKIVLIDNSFNGDQKIKLMSTLYGYAHYIKENLVQYNYGVKDSMTFKWNRIGKKDNELLWLKFFNLMNEINEFSECKYEDDFFLARNVYIDSILRRPYVGILNKNNAYRNRYKEYSIKKKLIFWIRLVLPSKILFHIEKKKGRY